MKLVLDVMDYVDVRGKRYIAANIIPDKKIAGVIKKRVKRKYTKSGKYSKKATRSVKQYTERVGEDMANGAGA